jgi:hypothetical protein
MASAMTATTKDKTEVLLLWPKSIAEKIQFAFTFMFFNLIGLSQYVSEKIKTSDKFIIVAPSDHLEDLLNDPVYKFPQVQFVYVSYKNNKELKQHEDRFKNGYPKLRFYHEDDLPARLDKFAVDNAIQESNAAQINDLASEIAQRVSAKRPRSTRRRSPVSTQKHGFSVQNIEQIDPKYICPSCKLIFREPVQLDNGDRICQSCINVENSGKICSEVSLEKNVRVTKLF